MPVRVHHLNCGTMCPRGASILGGDGGLLAEARLVCHCLLIEGDAGLVLVDTGVGMRDCDAPAGLGQPFRALIRPRCSADETAVTQLRSLGFDPADVRHVVTTHLDLDHAGGLPDFPDSEVHVFEAGRRAALDRALKDRGRYRPHHFAHGPRWAVHESDGDEWFGFESVRVLPDVGTDVLLIPLAGHSRGHTGVAIKRGDRWLLHCGDAYFHHGEVESPPHCPPGLALFQTIVGDDNGKRRVNQERLRELSAGHRDEIDLVCSHDAVELDRAQAAARDSSASAV